MASYKMDRLQSPSQEASTSHRESPTPMPKVHTQSAPSPLESTTLVYSKKGKAEKVEKEEEVIEEESKQLPSPKQIEIVPRGEAFEAYVLDEFRDLRIQFFKEDSVSRNTVQDIKVEFKALIKEKLFKSDIITREKRKEVYALQTVVIEANKGFSTKCRLLERHGARKTLFTSASLADREKMERQFEEFRQQLEESGSVRERLRGIVADLESVTRLLQANLLQVHYAAHSHDILKKANVHIGKLKELYGLLAEVIKGCPGQYYRYHDHWRNQTYNVVFLIVFMHWLETGNLLSYAETQNLLGLNSEEFGIDIEDYLIGLCNMSNELPRYVVNQVTMGDYECPGKVSRFLSDLYAAFRILNLRNDLLRKRFDGMKYDLRKVEEVLYDVKIRRLDSSESTMETNPDTS
ncbi:hypothetical protein KI387_007773 [Taxus chinensis]|uniref:Translin n=1 Tax=Taxus chinensis TaxID=29808 RepID=A0AA38GTM9_TAXCH|nr:hypothetical protein KI387_007773 [Taxus chinensis]